MIEPTHSFGQIIDLSNTKKRVLLRAPALTQSGYGVHSRQIAKWLLDRDGIDLRVSALMWGITPWMVDRGLCDGLAGRILNLCGPEQGGFDVSVQVQLPNEWDPKLARFNIGVTAGVETDRCNPQWVQCCNAMDLVIVPSKHTKRAFERVGGLKTKMVVVPESFPDAMNRPAADIEPLPIDIDPEFNFLVVAQFTGQDVKTDRKKLRETIKWLCEEFNGDPTTGIVLKANMGRNTRIDRNLCENALKQVIPKRKDGFPKISLVHGTMSNDEMAGMYHHPKVKAYVTCTRGEGYGLPVIEAAACGLPVVATNWSGHLDFMSLGKFIKLDYKLVEIPESKVDGNIFVKGAIWAETQEHDFKKKVRKLRENYAIPEKWAEELKKKILTGYSHQRICELYEDALGGVL